MHNPGKYGGIAYLCHIMKRLESILDGKIPKDYNKNRTNKSRGSET